MNMQPIERTEFYETAGGAVVALVYVKDTGLYNIAGSLNCCFASGLPCSIIPAAKEGMPFSPVYNPAQWEGKSMQQLETDVVQLGRHIATVYGEAGGGLPTVVYPEKVTPIGRMFIIRWFL